MKIGLIIIGDELLSGTTQDCNMLYLGEKLRHIGLDLHEVTVINDEAKAISEAYQTALEKYDLTFCSGGLGPTIDDRTKNALAAFLNVELEDNQTARKLTHHHYERRGLEWRPELNNYHLIPKGVTPFSNPKGMAPGLYLKSNGKELLCAPGVPREFQSMVDEFLEGHQVTKNLERRNYLTIRTAGIPEEQIFNHRCPTLWKTLSTFGSVSSYPRFTGIDIVINDIKSDETELIKTLGKLEELKPIETHVWHIGNGAIEEIVIELAKKNKFTLSSAESCTGGLIAHQLTEVSGSSDAFWGSVVSYDNSVKENILGVSKSSLEKFGAVSDEVAEQMAKGVREKLNTTYGVSTSGVAGPLGGSAEKPVGTVAISISGPKGSRTKTYHIPPIFDRDEMKKRFATRALVSLYKQMKLDLSEGK